MTAEELKACMPSVTDERIALYLGPLSDTIEKYGLNTPLRLAHFLAQIGHESMSLRYMEELADGSKYEGRTDLGNIYIGDGKKYKGRGAIQITGRTNYKLYGNYEGIDLLGHPHLLATPPYCIEGAGWFWESHNLNIIADKDDIVAITKKINGGENGLLQRKRRLTVAKTVFAIH